MSALIGFALLFGGKTSVYAVDGVFESWDFEFASGTASFDTYYNTDYNTKLSWVTYPYGSTGGFSYTNLALIYANNNSPPTPFTNCLPNGTNFLANSVFLAFNDPTTNWCDAKPLTGASNGILHFTNILAVCFLPNGSFIMGGSFTLPGGYANSINIAYVNAEGVVQNIVFQALGGEVTSMTDDAGDVLVQGTFTEVNDSVHGLTAVDGATGVVWRTSLEEWQLGG